MSKALAMISGGLDSALAAKLIKDQGIEVIGVCFKSYFFNESNALKIAREIDIPVVVVDFSREHFEMVKNPKHGYGKNINPCIDCHAMMMNYTGKMLKEYNADFIITGEVLNQRPMSQTEASLNIVKNESGFADRILRPLCAKNLKPTEMELSGMVDRERLMDISGRERKIQMKLADEWGIKDYPSPAGGCKLTDPNYSVRLKDLLKHEPDPQEREVRLLVSGRHFRVSETAKVISSRTEEEENIIKGYLTEKDMIFMARDFAGSMIVIIGKPDEDNINFSASLAARYCKGKNNDKVIIKYGHYNHEMDNFIEAVPVKDEIASNYSINI